MRDGRPPLELFAAMQRHPSADPTDDAGTEAVAVPLFAVEGDPVSPRSCAGVASSGPGPRRHGWTARYGPEFGRGLLFGKHAGVYRFEAHRETRGQQHFPDTGG